MPRFVFEIFNVVFIALYQNVLLLLISLPAYTCWKVKKLNPYPGPLDLVATVLFLFFLGLETLSDGQQWNFQLEKQRRLNAGLKLRGDYLDGFIQRGLFRYSRHPNFFAEMGIWWSFYLFSVSATGTVFNWTALGPVLLTLLFQGSTWFTELISAKKYPKYAEYKRRTSRLLPMPVRLSGPTKVRKED